MDVMLTVVRSIVLFWLDVVYLAQLFCKWDMLITVVCDGCCVFMSPSVVEFNSNINLKKTIPAQKENKTKSAFSPVRGICLSTDLSPSSPHWHYSLFSFFLLKLDHGRLLCISGLRILSPVKSPCELSAFGMEQQAELFACLLDSEPTCL